MSPAMVDDRTTEDLDEDDVDLESIAALTADCLKELVLDTSVDDLAEPLMDDFEADLVKEAAAVLDELAAAVSVTDFLDTALTEDLLSAVAVVVVLLLDIVAELL